MFLQNTTFVISDKIEKVFLQWLRTEFAAAARGAGAYYSEPKLHRILELAEPGTMNFAFQLRTDDIDKARRWLQEGEGAALLAEFTRRFDGQTAYFSTFMDEMEV